MALNIRNIPIGTLRSTFGTDAKLTKAAELMDANAKTRIGTNPTHDDYDRSNANQNGALEANELYLASDPFFPADLKPYAAALGEILNGPYPDAPAKFTRYETSSQIVDRPPPSSLPVSAFAGSGLEAAVAQLVTLQGHTDSLDRSTLDVAKGSDLFKNAFGDKAADTLAGFYKGSRSLAPPASTTDRKVVDKPGLSITARLAHDIDASGNVTASHPQLVIHTQPNAVIAVNRQDQGEYWDPTPSKKSDRGMRRNDSFSFVRADLNGDATVPARFADFLAERREMGTQVMVLDDVSLKPLGSANVMFQSVDNHEHI